MSIKMNSRPLILLCTLIFVIIACKRPPKGPIEVDFGIDFDQIDYPVAALPDIIAIDINSRDSLYPVSDNFINQFLKKVSQTTELTPTMPTDFPSEWGVKSIERLVDGKDLWLLQSLNREWLYLVVTTGSGTQRVLDILPVAMNIVIQHHDVIETEVWQTRREPDGSFIVEKNYEWTKSLGEASREDVEANPEAFFRKSFIIHKYQLNEMGYFDYIEIEEEIGPEYSAVFFYFQRDEKPQDWDDVMERVQSFCEEKNIYFDELSGNFEEALIRNFKYNDSYPVDISPYAEEFNAGMVMMKNGEESKNVIFGSEERLKIEIKRYFKLMNQ